MLSQQALDWWFSPWTYAAGGAGFLPLAAEGLGQRDGYRLWCGKANVAAELPSACDPGWEAAFITSGDELMATARLFRGLMLAREQNLDKLAGLPIADRKWCCSIASTQPLRPVRHDGAGRPESIDVEGLVDIAVRLEHGFPGAWPRLRLTLPETVASGVDALMPHVHEDRAALDTSTVRAQRCWRLCRARVSAGAGHS